MKCLHVLWGAELHKQFWVFTKSALIQITVEPIANPYEVKKFLLPEKMRSEKNGYESLVKISEREYLIGTAMGYTLLDTQIETEPYNAISITKITILFRLYITRSHVTHIS
jgi:hypothetical protein